MQNLQSPFSFSDTNMEILNNFPQMNLNCGENIQSSFEFSHDNFLYPMPEFPGKLADNFPGFFSDHKNITVPVLPITEPVTSTENDMCKGKKRRSMETLENSSANSSFPASGNAIKKKNSSARVKRLKINGKEDEKNKEVVHVRARRGQATDSHSIAERIRRGKINEKLKCLQSIVPGCYKAMGMAVMLDEIINYVHSLQSQVEFLSMKLTVASTFPEFNSEDVLENLQRVKAYEVMDGSEGVVASTHFGPNLDPNLGCYSSLAYNK